MVVKITLVKNFHFHVLPLNLLCTKCAKFFGLTLTAPIIVMSPSGRTCDKYKIVLQLKLKGNFKMWICGTLPWEPGKELSGRCHQSETCAVYFLSRPFKKMFHLAARNNSFPRGNNFDRLKIRGGRNWGLFAWTCFAFSAKTFTCGIRRQSLKKSIIIGLRLTFLAITFMHWNWSFDL